MSAGRRLIVNADDFGLSEGVNQGVVRAHRDGIVTSASLMVRWPAAVDAMRLATEHPQLGIGIHVDLGEWYYADGEWPERYHVVELSDPDAVRRQIDEQLERFIRLAGRSPTHIDSHQHVHHDRVVAPHVRAAAHRLGVPVRAVAPGPRYCGDFYGQDGRGHPVPEAISVDALVRIIEDLPDGDTELACHPGLDAALATTYRDERAIEVETLCHPAVRAAVDATGTVLVSFEPWRRPAS